MNWSDLDSALMDTLGDSFGMTATLRRGAVADEGITVLEGKHATQTIDPGSGATIESTARDWLLKVDQLTNLEQPQAGDLLEITIGATLQTWELMPPTIDSADVDYSDHAENSARCHARLIATEPAP